MRSETSGALLASAAYSIATASARGVPPASGSRLWPSVQGITSSMEIPARSHSVGVTSRVETGSLTSPGAMPGAETISGTREEPSKKFILNHSPRSPSMSPWSDTKTTMASCRVSSSACRISPILSSQ